MTCLLLLVFSSSLVTAREEVSVCFVPNAIPKGISVVLGLWDAAKGEGGGFPLPLPFKARVEALDDCGNEKVVTSLSVAFVAVVAGNSTGLLSVAALAELCPF